MIEGSLMRRLLLVTLVSVLLLLAPGAAGAAPGDVLQRFTLDMSGTACSVSGEPNTPVGIVVMGSKLRVSCWSDHTISTFSTATGARVGKPKVISGISRLGALTFDRATRRLYACGDGGLVGTINLRAKTFTTVFSATCVDGLMWDPVDNTFWAHGDYSPTIEHYDSTGTPLSSTDIRSLLGGCSNTGIEAVGGELMLATGPCSSGPIYASTRALDSASVFTLSDAFVEDMACDRGTFAAVNKTAIWVVHPYDTEVVAYEAPSSGPTRSACK